MKASAAVIVVLVVVCLAGAHANRVIVAMRQQNMDTLRDIALSVSDPRNDAYGNHLTRDQLGKLIAPTPETVDEVTSWLRTLGAEHVSVNPRGDWATGHNVDITSQQQLEDLIGATQRLRQHIDFATFYSDNVRDSYATFVDQFGVMNVVDDATASQFGLSDNAEAFVRLSNTERTSEHHRELKSNVIVALSRPGTRSLSVAANANEALLCKTTVVNSEEFMCSKSCESLYDSMAVKSTFGRAGTQALAEYCGQMGQRFSEICVATDVVINCFDQMETSDQDHLVTVSVRALLQDGTSLVAEHSSVGGNAIPFRIASQLYDPNSQKAFYDMPTSVVGVANSTQAVWGTGTYGYSVSDLSQFYSEYDIPTSTDYVQSVGYAGVIDGDNFVEGQLDNQYLTGLAPQVATTSFNNDNSSSAEASIGFGPAMISFLEALAANPTQPDVLSISLGSLTYSSCNLLCEVYDQQYDAGGYDDCVSYTESQFQVCMYTSNEQMARLDNEYMALASLGVSVFAASGDGGNHFSFGAFHKFQQIGAALNEISCNYTLPTFPASSPWVTAVGGVMITQGPNGDEQAVGCQAQEGGTITGGCGFSWQFEMPSYQVDAVQAYLNSAPITNYNFNATGRGYPDISGIAANVPIINDGRQEVVGGTSASTPETAGLFSIINDQRLSKGLPRLGFINIRLYQAMADAATAASLFYDVVEGTSECGTNICCDNGFVAQQGWDAFTGWGSPLYTGLLAEFGSD